MLEGKESQVIDLAGETARREARAVLALVDQLDRRILPVLRLLLDCRGHVLVTGAGTSRAIAQRFAHLLSCCGTPALCLSAADAIHGGSGAITDRDVVYIISKGGQSAEINQLAAIARQRGARIVAHTERPDSPLGRMSDAVFQVVAPADVDPFGMIATGSSLVNGAACDALCVALLELRGYTRERFADTHPGGAVGIRIQEEIHPCR